MQDSNGFEVSMGMQDRPPDPQFIAEQTFHTPSFGDEEFEIPPITLPSSTTSAAPPSGNFVQNYADSLDHSHGMGGQQMDHVTSSAPPMMHYAPQGVYLSTVNEAGAMLAPAQHQFQQQPRMMAHHHQTQQQQQQHCGVTSTSNLMTISQSQLSAHLGLHFTVPVAVPATSTGGSPPRSDQTSPRQETSEDSDDSAGITHALMDGWMKRPSPDPPGAKTVTKKSKVPKKKKKRDPNEPQKPVSAYALFFRDTQAAIKGQNPNASFGEVSKIVASMWDSLDDDHKNVYKKKTEAAKKEYLKALAAYRASLVSTSGSAEQADSSSGAVYGSGPSYSAPAHFSTVPTTTSHGGGNGNGNGGNGQQLSPLQKKSPLLTSLMEGSIGPSSNVQSPPQPPPLQHSPPLMIAPMTTTQGQMTVNAGLQSQQHPHQQHPHQQLQQVQGHISNIATRSPPLSQQQLHQQQQHQQQQHQQHLLPPPPSPIPHPHSHHHHPENLSLDTDCDRDRDFESREQRHRRENDMAIVRASHYTHQVPRPPPPPPAPHHGEDSRYVHDHPSYTQRMPLEHVPPDVDRHPYHLPRYKIVPGMGTVDDREPRGRQEEDSRSGGDGPQPRGPITPTSSSSSSFPVCPSDTNAHSAPQRKLTTLESFASRGMVSSMKQFENDPSKLLLDVLEKEQPEPSSGRVMTAKAIIDVIVSHHMNMDTMCGSKPGNGNGSGSSGGSGGAANSPGSGSGGEGADGKVSPYKSVGRMAVPKAPSSALKDDLVMVVDDVTPPLPPRAPSAASTYSDGSRGGRTPIPLTPASPSPGPISCPSGNGGSNKTFKEHMDSIIAKDYQNNSRVELLPSPTGSYGRNRLDAPVSTSSGSRSSLYQPQQQCSSSSTPGPQVPTDLRRPSIDGGGGNRNHGQVAMDEHPSWKLRKALQQQDKEKQQQQSSNPMGGGGGVAGGGMSSRHLAPDERQIIRIAQSSSPRLPLGQDPMKFASLSPKPLRISATPPLPHSLRSYQVEPISPPGPPTPTPDSNNNGELLSASSSAGVGTRNQQQSPVHWMSAPSIAGLLAPRRVYQPPDSSEAAASMAGVVGPGAGSALVPRVTASSAQPNAGGMSGTSSTSDPQQHVYNPLEYVKHRIVEAMRNNSADVPGSSSEQQHRLLALPVATQAPRVTDECYRMPEAGGDHPPPESSGNNGKLSSVDYPPHRGHKRPLDSVEVSVSGSSDGGRRGGGGNGSSSICSSVGRAGSLSPSSSGVLAEEGCDESGRKRPKLECRLPAAPESSSSERVRKMLLQSSDGSNSSSSRAGGDHQHFHSAGKQQTQQGNHGQQRLSSSSDVADGVATDNYPQSSHKEGEGVAAESSTTTSKATARGLRTWDDEVSSAPASAGAVIMVDSPQSGDMVIDESAAADGASSSKLEPVSPLPQDGISTSDRRVDGDAAEQQATSSSAATCSSVTPGQGDRRSNVTSEGHQSQSVSSSHRGQDSSPEGSSTSSSVRDRDGRQQGKAPPYSSISSTVNVANSGSSSSGPGSGNSGPSSESDSAAPFTAAALVTTTYYPYSALNVRPLASAPSSAGVPNPGVGPCNVGPCNVGPCTAGPGTVGPGNARPSSPASSSDRGVSPVPPTRDRDEPAPLMSSQYEPLSDED